MSGPDRPIQPEHRIEARRWLLIVEEDIDVATAAARLSRLGASAYHVQQAAEKRKRGKNVGKAAFFSCSGSIRYDS